MTLSTASAFFDIVKRSLFLPTLTQGEVDGCNTLLTALEGEPLAFCAYGLATAYHETASTMQPVKEFGGPTYLTRMYDIQGARPKLALSEGNLHPGDGIKYCGRGYVQLTWANNYKLAGDDLGYDLVDNPDLALRPDVAAAVMRRGMDEGWFTGKKFSSYLPSSGAGSLNQFISARYIINGTDKALQIADHALVFQSALQAGGWA